MGPTVGWNNLLIVLFWPINYAQMAPGRAESAFGLLDPAGLNWHFGAETDLFNFQCSSHSDGHRMPSVVVHLFLFFHYKISVRFRKIPPSFSFVSSLFHLMLQCNIQQSLSVEKQFFFLNKSQQLSSQKIAARWRLCRTVNILNIYSVPECTG